MGSYDKVIARLRAQRQALGLTMREVAAKIGERTTAQTLAYYETGKRRPSIDYLEAWAAALGLTVVVDVGEADPDEARLLEAFRRADPRLRRLLLAQADAVLQ